MLRKGIKLPIIFVVIALKIVGLFGEGEAAVPEVRLVVNPRNTDIYAGSGRVVITVKAPGANLTFTWKLSGPGKIEDEGAAAFYVPPEKIDQDSAHAVVTVTVKEESGQETVKSVSFTILPSQVKIPTPSPVATPSKKKKMSKGKITALSLGAVAALGGGIALAAGGGGDGDGKPKTCAGTWVGGYCWYLGAKGESCTSVCASHGGYHEATRSYAGSDGYDSRCMVVLTELGAPSSYRTYLDHGAEYGLGCSYDTNSGDGRIQWARPTAPTTAEASWSSYTRACACEK